MAHEGLGRDDLIRVIFEADFCDQNPAFEDHREEITACRDAYNKSAAKNTCRCGGNPRLVFACTDNVLAKLSAFKTANPGAVQAFVSFVGQKRNKALTSITIYYRKTSEFPLQKFRFP